jgi:hypothetical protein
MSRSIVRPGSEMFHQVTASCSAKHRLPRRAGSGDGMMQLALPRTRPTLQEATEHAPGLLQNRDVFKSCSASGSLCVPHG